VIQHPRPPPHHPSSYEGMDKNEGFEDGLEPSLPETADLLDDGSKGLPASNSTTDVTVESSGSSVQSRDQSIRCRTPRGDAQYVRGYMAKNGSLRCVRLGSVG
jgi:hypothetical protein